jgi:hypothetical protein
VKVGEKRLFGNRLSYAFTANAITMHLAALSTTYFQKMYRTMAEEYTPC